MHDGTSYTELTFCELQQAWGWLNTDVSAILDTWTKIDAAKIYVKASNTAIYKAVDCAYLKIDWTTVTAKGFSDSGSGSDVFSKEIPPVLIDSYPEENQDGTIGLKDHHPSDSTYFSAAGQSFNCAGGNYKLTSCKFYMLKVGLPTGNGHAVLYEHSGTYGTSSVPTGSPLATSDDFDVSTLGTSLALVTFTFTGAQQYQMTQDTKYVIVFENPATGTIDPDNKVVLGLDLSSPTHGGNLCRFANGSWVADSANDLIFYVYGEVPGVTNKDFSDTGGGTEVFGIPFKALPFTDVGGGSDAFATPFKAMGFSDVGSGVDVFKVLLWKSFVDAGSGSDSFLAMLFKAFADAGLGSDVFAKEVIGFIEKGFSDTGLGTDVFVNPFRAMGFVDVGSGADVFIIPYKELGFADVGAGVDAFGFIVLRSFSDAGSGVDVFSISWKELGFQDVGGGADVFVIPFKALKFSDAGSGIDVFTIPFKALGFSDVGSGSDSFAVLLWKNVVDYGYGTDAFEKEALVVAVFVSYGPPFKFDSADWGAVNIYLEVYMRAVTGTAKARLYNETDELEVANSELSTIETSMQRLRSVALTLIDGKVYRIQFGKVAPDEGAFLGGKLIIKD